MDNSETLAMCDALSFEELDWIPVGGGSSTDATLSTMNVADGDTAFQVSLFTDSYVDLEAGVNISMPFSEGATSVTARLDVFSPNAAPYQDWSGEISLYLMAEGGTSYELAGTMIYDPTDIYADDFTTLQIAFSPAHSQLLLTGTASAMLSVSASQNNAVFYLDRLQFCDNNGACNLGCPTLPVEGHIPDEATPPVVVAFEDDDTADANPNGMELWLRNTTLSTVTVNINVGISNGVSRATPETAGTVSIQPRSSAPFLISAARLSAQEKFVQIAYVSIEQIIGNETLSLAAANRYYTQTENGIRQFSESAFMEDYDGVFFSFRPGDIIPDSLVSPDGIITLCSGVSGCDLDELFVDTDSDTTVVIID